MQVFHSAMPSRSKSKYTLVNEIIKLSRGEICVANLIPPANGASLGSYNDNNFVNESHLLTQGKTIAKTYTTHGTRTVYI